MRLKPEFVQHGSTNIELPLGSERALSDGEDRQHFDCATWLHKAREMSKGKVKREVEKELTGRETEAWETNHASVGPLRIGAPPFAPWPGPSSLQREDEPPVLLIALRHLAQAQGIAKVAKAAGIEREVLYRALSVHGNPCWPTLVAVTRAIGLRPTVEAAH